MCSAWLEELKICTGYELNGESHRLFSRRQLPAGEMPARSTRRCPAGTSTLPPGPQADRPSRRRPPLCRSAQCASLSLPMSIVSVGPDRDADDHVYSLTMLFAAGANDRMPLPLQNRYPPTPRRRRPRSGAAAAARRGHHGRQRPLGAAARLAADRGPSPRRAERARHHRGMLPAWAGAIDALLSQHRELEAAPSSSSIS